MNLRVVNGPNQGQAVASAEKNVEYRLPHPARVGVHCRYLVRNWAELVSAPDGEQGEEEVALHYAGNFLSRSEDQFTRG